jgi:hypothetical protein
MLAAVRSAMEREFADFFETGAGDENPKVLAASFSEGMGQRISQRLRQLKAGQPAILAKGKDLVASFAKLVPGPLFMGTRASVRAIAYAAGVEAGDRLKLRGRKPKSS